MGYRRQKLLIIKSGEGGGAVTEDAIALISGAALNTGVGQPTDTLDLVALDDTTLRIKAAQQMFFTANFAVGVPIAEAMVSFPQIDYPLASLGLAADGTYLRYIGYDVDGNVVVGTSNFYMSPNVAHLGFVLVKRVGGVTTFLDGAAGLRNVSSSPMLAGSSLLERAYATTQSNVSVLPLSGGLTFAKQAGVIRAPSINWHGGANIHELPVAAQSPAAFTRINPASASSPALPAAGTAFNATTYWNGVASVAVPNPTNATVQRWLVGFKGGLWLQEGERFYNNLSDAADALWNAPFTNIYPADTYAEVARTAATKNVADVGNNAQSVTVQTGHVGGSGSGAAGSGPVFAESLLGVTIAPNVVNASLNHLTPAGGLLTITGAASITDATPAVSTTTGALTIAGGLGVAGDAYANNMVVGDAQAYWWGGAGGVNHVCLEGNSDGHISVNIRGVQVAQFYGNGLQMYRLLATTNNINVDGGINVFGGPTTLQGGLVMQPKSGSPFEALFYNTDNTSITYLTEIGATGSNLFQIRPNNIVAAAFTTTQTSVPIDFKTVKGRVVGLSPQTGTSLALDSSFHYVTAGNAGATVYNLPPVATNAGREYWIKNVGGLAVTIVPNGAETIYTTAQVANVVLNPGQWLHVVSTGVYWIETGTNSSTSSLLILPASTTISASMRMPHGVAPSAPVNGDMWTTATGAFVQIGGVTVQFGSTTTGTTDAGTLTGATLAANVINASINHITPIGSNLTITGTGLMTGNFLMQGNTANFGAAGNPSLFNLNLHGNTGGTLTFQINGGAITSRIEGNSSTLLLDGPQVTIDVAGTLRAFFHTTGLQVQGTIASTGSLSVTGNVNVTSDINLSRTGPGAAITWSDSARLSVPSTKSFLFSVDGGSTNVVTVSSTGLAVTGNISATSTMKLQRASGSLLLEWAKFSDTLTGAASDNLSIGNGGGGNLYLWGAGTLVANISAAGLAVTGTINSSGNITTVGGQFIGVSGSYLLRTATEDVLYADANNAILRSPNGGAVRLRPGSAGDVAYAVASGFEVTGRLILLTNNTYFTGRDTGGAALGLIGMGADDVTHIQHKVGSSTKIGDSGAIYATVSSAGLVTTLSLTSVATANNQQPSVSARAVDYASSFKAVLLIYSGDAVTGTTAGLSNSNLGWLNFQNCANALISTNGATSILMAPQGIGSMRWNPASIDVLTYLNYGTVAGNIAPPSYGTRSAGTRIVLYGNTAPADTDFALGIESNAIWMTASANGSIRFYGGTNLYGYWSPGLLVSNGDFVISGGYMNFAGVQGASGYGFRNNGGTIEWKNAGGAWAAIGGGGGGGVTSVGIVGNNGITVISGSPITTNGNINLGLGDITPNSVNVATVYKVGGTQVVGTRQPKIVTINLTNGNYNTEFNTINIALNNVIFILRNHGLIDPTP